MTQRTDSAGLSEFADALVEAACPIAIVLGELARARTQPDPEEARALLAALLHDVLQPLGTILAPRDLRTTTAVLEAVAPLMLEHVLPAPHDPPPLPRRDARRAHRRPLRATNRRLRERP